MSGSHPAPLSGCFFLFGLTITGGVPWKLGGQNDVSRESWLRCNELGHPICNFVGESWIGILSYATRNL